VYVSGVFQDFWRNFGPAFKHFFALFGFTTLLATITLAVVRVWVPSTLLFDQFLVLTLLIFLILSVFLVKKKKLRTAYFFSADAVTKILVSGAISLLFFSTVQYSVLTVDRSRSLYLFAWIKSGAVKYDGKRITVLDFSKDPADLQNTEAIAQRIDEQRSRFLMSVSNKDTQLTFGGNCLLRVSRILASIFNLRGWYANT